MLIRRGISAAINTRIPTTPGADYGPCGYDIRNNTNATIVVKSLFLISRCITGYVLNNWELAPLLRVVTSQPFTRFEGQDESFTGNGGDRSQSGARCQPHPLRQKILSDHGGTVYANQSYLNQASFHLEHYHPRHTGRR